MTPLRFREKRKNRGLRAICRDCAGKKVEGRLKPAEADRALDGYSLSSDAGLAAPPTEGGGAVRRRKGGRRDLRKVSNK